MNTILYAISENTKEGLIIGGKMIAGIIIAALILYGVLIITRIGGKKINKYLYKRYKNKYIDKHGDSNGLMSFEEFLESKSNTKTIENPQNQSNSSFLSNIDKPINNSINNIENDKSIDSDCETK